MAQSRSFVDEIRANKRSSVFIIFLVAVVWLALGFSIGMAYGDYRLGILLAAGFTVLQLLVLSGGSQAVLATVGAREASEENYRQLHNVVEEVCIAAGIPKPKVYVMNSDMPNAFATGMKPETAAVAVTTGLMRKLNRNELQGVIAHEISHIRNYDIRVSVVLAVMVGSIVLLSGLFLRWGWFFAGGSGRSRSREGGGQLQMIFLLVAIALAILAPIFAVMMQFAVSRKREYLADASAAELTRYPEGLAGALKKISSSPNLRTSRDEGRETKRARAKAMSHFYIVNPFKKKLSSSGMFDTHPPIDERVKRLEQMAHIYREPEVDESKTDKAV